LRFCNSAFFSLTRAISAGDWPLDAALADMDGCRIWPENDRVGKVDIVIVEMRVLSVGRASGLLAVLAMWNVVAMMRARAPRG
jgi:hypothetical protein